ncbi:hypothetical protein [Mesobacillus maritimus]|uniref:hypothetical protein n=1 Tax=Mesobacillus maritimus TaxID=1643336 RepID=UPI0038514969
MKKKMIAAFGISGALLISSVYSISANTSGYELYKDALKNTHQLESTTMNMSLVLDNNNKEIYRMDSIVKTNRLEDSLGMEGTVSNGLEEMTYEMTKQDGEYLVRKENDKKVYVMESNGSNHGAGLDGDEGKELRNDLENLVDLLTKNYQQKITVEGNEDGTQRIDLELSSSELPIAMNAVTSLMYKHGVMLDDRADDSEASFHSVKPELPKLKKDILIEDIKISAKVSEGNYIEEQFVTAIFSGKDASGTSKKLQFSFKLELTNANETIVSPMDVTGLELVEFQHGHGK